LEEADAAAATRGALLRREGLYFSLLTTWRRERARGIREVLTSQRRGPKSKRNPFEEENQKLHRQVGQLTEKLRKAEIIIDVQKNLQPCWGTRFPTRTRTRNPDVRDHRTGDRHGHQRSLPGSVDAAGVLLLRAVP